MMTHDNERVAHETTVEEWIAALESGRYPKGEGGLCVDGAYCCLGVLSQMDGDLIDPDEWWHEEERKVSAATGETDWYFGTGEIKTFLTSDTPEFDMSRQKSVADLLAELNDVSDTFASVVAEIRRLHAEWKATQ